MPTLQGHSAKHPGFQHPSSSIFVSLWHVPYLKRCFSFPRGCAVQWWLKAHTLEQIPCVQACLCRLLLCGLGTSLVAQTVKHLSTMQETWVQSLGRENPLEKEMAIHSSTIAWKIPWAEEPGSPWGRKELDTTERLHSLRASDITSLCLPVSIYKMGAVTESSQ